MPNKAGVHTDRPLTSFAVAQQPITNYPLATILKPLQVQNSSDTFYVYGAEWQFGNEEATGRTRFARAPRAKYEGFEYNVTTATYSCVEYGLQVMVDDSEQANADRPLDPLQDGALSVRTQLMSAYHARLAALLTDSASTFSSYTSGAATAWSSHDTAVPLDDSVTAQESLRDNGTFNPAVNEVVCAMGKPEWYDLIQNADLIDRVKYTGGGGAAVTMEAAAQYLQVDRVVVVDQTMNTSKDGQTFAAKEAWTANVIGFYSVPKSRPALKAPGLGFTAIWSRGNSGDAATGMKMLRYRDESRNLTIVRGNHHTDEKVSQAAAGYIITGA